MNVSTDKIASAGWHLAGHQSPQWHQRGKCPVRVTMAVARVQSVTCGDYNQTCV